MSLTLTGALPVPTFPFQALVILAAVILLSRHCRLLQLILPCNLFIPS